MAGSELKITISAQDDASQVFRKIATEAGKVADQLEKAGKDGGKGFEELGKGADKAEASFAKLSSTGDGTIRTFDGLNGEFVKMGSGLQSMGLALDSVGQSYISQQQRLDTLQRQYGSFTQEMVSFSQQMQSQTTFSDDAIQKGLVFFASLREQYGLSIEQIKQLSVVTADLAQANGLAYEDAAQRVQAAVRGETEGAEILGLALNQQSIDRQNLTLTMTNQEAAQFRLNALLEQASYAQGSSAAAVETANGQWKQFTNQVQDAQQAVGQFIGPVGDIFTTLGGGLQTVAEATRGVKELGQGFSAVGLFLKANPLALAATGIAAATVAFVGWTRTLKDGENAADRFAASISKITESGGTITGGDLWKGFKEFIGLGADAVRVYTSADEAIWDMLDHIHVLNNQGNRAAASQLADLALQAQNAQEVANLYINSQGFQADAAKMAEEQSISLEQAQNNLTAAYTLSTGEAQAYATALGVLGKAMEDPTVNTKGLLDAFNSLYYQYLDGSLTLDEFTGKVTNLAHNVDAYKTSTTELTASQLKLNKAMAEYGLILGEDPTPKTADEVKKLNEEVKQTVLLREQMAAAPGQERDLVIQRQRLDLFKEELVTQKELNDAWMAGDYALYNDLMIKRMQQQQMLLDLRKALRESDAAEARELVGVAEANERVAAAEERRIKNMGVFNQQVSAKETATRLTEDQAAGEERVKALAEGATAAIERQADAYHEMATTWAEMTGQDDFVSQLNLSGHGTEFTQLAGNIADANTALQDGYRIIVQNTDAIGQNAQAVEDWITKLVGAEGEAAALDEAYGRWIEAAGGDQEKINAAQEKYNDIIADSTRIQAANASIQQSIQDIQLNQTGLMADLTEQQAVYMDQLAQMPADQQLITLGWMDATEAAKANQAVTMAAAAANGELGASGQEAVEKMILAQAQADPIYKQMLLDIGLLEEKTDEFGNKTLTVNFDGAEGMNNDIQELTKSIDALTLALGGVPPLHIDVDSEYAKSEIDAVRERLTGTKKDAEETNQALKDLASGKDVNTEAVSNALQSVADHFRDLDGMTATPKVDADTGDSEAKIQAIDDLLRPLDGKTFETRVRVLLDDETGGDGGLDGRLGRFGGNGRFDASVHIPTVLDPPEGLPDFSGVPPVPVRTELEPPAGPPDFSGVPPVRVPAELTFAGGPFDAQGPGGGLPDFGGDPIMIHVEADVADAVIGLYNVQQQADNLAASNPTLTISEVGSGQVIGAATAVTNTINDIPDDHSTAITLIGAEAAIGNAQAVANTINAIPDSKTSTINVVTQYSTIGTPGVPTGGGGTQNQRHGGLLAYANGGLIPHIAGEGNLPEMAHYANGGMAILPFEGLYASPPNTYISPAPANPGISGGGWTINFNGNFYGSNRVELNEWAAKDLLPQLAEQMETRRRAMGGWR